jgi:hypothetical protein
VLVFSTLLLLLSVYCLKLQLAERKAERMKKAKQNEVITIMNDGAEKLVAWIHMAPSSGL